MILGIFRRYTYDVAFSFADEDRDFVNRVTDLLKAKQAKVYNYEDKRTESWGKDLRSYLDNIYRIDSRFCVVFISQHYKIKHWSQHEWEHAKARSFFKKHKEYILPYRLDDTVIPGLDPAMSYLSNVTHDEQELADAILEKIGQRRWRPIFRAATISKSPAMMGKTSITVLATILLSSIGVLTYQKKERPDTDVKQESKTPIDTPIVATTLFDAKKIAKEQGNYPKRRDAPVISFKGVHQKGWYFTAVCKDGWLSQSKGNGTCSGHGGIKHYVDTLVYASSLLECRQKAMQNFQASQ